ncbi:hypothetical protein TCAL_14725 [Tigriopus californicus]|uniref:DUF7153 domain-containing protein n=1 Tax=Tigriopus californicus TaxID=6832 RepID=A0A553PFJ3_TIGCA|nr:hypothetical protein TCAL_14725 [Tigriopus californicus]
MERTDQSSLFGSQAVFTFVHPTEKLKITYREQQSRLRLAVARHRDLQEGAVLDTLEKGVGYPVIHVNFHPKIKPPSDQPSMRDQGSGLIGHGTRQRAEPKTIPNNNNPNNSSSHSGIAPSPSVGSLLNQVPHPHSCWASSSSSSSQVQKSSSSSSVNNHYRSSFSTSTSSYSTSTSNAKRSSSTSHLTSGKSGTNSSIPKLLKENALGPAVHVQQGLYEEVKRIEPDFAFSPRDNIDTRAYIILGFKTLDTGFSSVLEQTWRDWTGARAIYLRLHNDFDLSKLCFQGSADFHRDVAKFVRLNMNRLMEMIVLLMVTVMTVIFYETLTYDACDDLSVASVLEGGLLLRLLCYGICQIVVLFNDVQGLVHFSGERERAREIDWRML